MDLSLDLVSFVRRGMSAFARLRSGDFIRIAIGEANTMSLLESPVNRRKVRHVRSAPNQFARVLKEGIARNVLGNIVARVRVFNRFVRGASLFGLALVLACGGFSLPAAAQDAPRVVVTSKPIHSIAAAVMGEVGTPELLITGMASPHVYALKPSDARLLNSADVFVRVSEQVEPFSARIIRALPDTVEVVTLAETKGLRLLGLRFGGHFDAHDHGDGHGHDQGPDQARVDEGKKNQPLSASTADGHVWLDPENAKLMARHLAEVFAVRSPRYAAIFAVNAKRFADGVTQASVEIEAELLPVRDVPFVVFHDAFHYFEARFGLNAAGAITVNPEVPPGARRLAALRQRIQSLGGVCVFAEPQFNSRVLEAVSTGTGARSGILDPIGVDLEPGAGLYTTMLRNLAHGFASCLAGRVKRAGP